MAATRRPPKGNESGASRRGRPRKMSRTDNTAEPPEAGPSSMIARDFSSCTRLTVAFLGLENVEEGTAEMASQQLAQEALRSEPLQSAEGELSITYEQAIEELPVLYGTADGLLKGLSLEKDPLALAIALADPKSRLNKKFNALATCLEDEKESFTLTEDPVFIDAARVNRVLEPTLHNGLTEGIVSKINLATLALQLRSW